MHEDDNDDVMLWDEYYEDQTPVINRWIELRKEHNLTQKQLAKKMDMEEEDIKDIEEGRRSIRILMIIRLCAALNISPPTFYEYKNKCKIISILPHLL